VTERHVTVVGGGRAGGSFAGALGEAGWTVTSVDRALLASGGADSLPQCDLVLLCVPDAAIEEVSLAVPVDSSRVVAHCAGSVGLELLSRHPARASVHPLVSLPDPEVGAGRLRGAWFAVSGDPLAAELVEALGGRFVEVDDGRRAAYHAAAVVASNHLVALMGQVERIAASAGVPLEAFIDLAQGSLDNAASLGPAAALTGPVSRGDWSTVRSHLAAIDESERDAYVALVTAAARLAGRDVPDLGRR